MPASASLHTATHDHLVTASLLVAAAGGWWYALSMSAPMTGGMSEEMGAAALSLGAFLLAWFAMMAAMMLPAAGPVVRLYARLASRSVVAPVPIFVAGYLLVWTAAGVPAYLAWRALADPLSMHASWAGRLAGGVLLAAAAYQLTPLKGTCLRHCTSPLHFLLAQGDRLASAGGALRAGLQHGGWCLGCCGALMAALVALGTMQPLWMAGLAAVIYLEKATRLGRRASPVIAAGLAAVGVTLLAEPALIAYLAV